MSATIYLDFSPIKGCIGVELDAPIFFRIEDVTGIDLSTLNVNINGDSAILGGVFQLGYEGLITQENQIPSAISVNIYKSDVFNYSEIITVFSEVSSSTGEASSISYDFRTISDPLERVPLVAVDAHGGVYNNNILVNIASDLPSTIFYTLDGSIPNLYSQIYTSPISINEGRTTLRFIAVLLNSISRIVTESYIVDSVAPESYAVPSGGSYFDSKEIVLSSDDSDALIYYTTDNSIPTKLSTVYTSPIKIYDNRNTTLKFFAVDKAGNEEAVNTEVYNIEISKNNFIPTNVFVTCPFNQSELYIRWDDMYHIYNEVVGYNIYRSDVEMGPYQKLNNDVVSITQYLDKTLDSEIITEDVSEQFRRTVNINRIVNDKFDSTCPFDKSRWNKVDPGQLLFQYDGAIFKDSVGLRQTSKLVSKFKLRGDFEIRVKYDLLKWILPDSGIQSCSFIVKKNDYDFIEISRSMSHLSDMYCTNQYVNGNSELPFTLLTTEDSSEFKIVRIGDIVTTYFYDSNTSSYVQLGAFDRYVEDLYVELLGKSSDKHVEIKFLDFVVITGNPIVIQPLNPRKEYVIYLSKRPVVDNTGTNNPTDDIAHIDLTIDGQHAYIRQLQGLEGLIEIETEKVYDEVKKKFFTPIVPNEFSTVIVKYRVPYSTTNIRLRKNYFYKVTCVTSNDETDLDLISPECLKPEKMTYILEEAVRRNAWMLDQGGERVLLYIKKRAGINCRCTYRDLKERTHKQPDQDCDICFGSGFVGGFDGPFPIVIAPLTTEQRVQQTERGLKLAYQIETWIGPTPIVSQRDMIIRRNGDRCLVGPLTPVEGPGGVIAQQHFVVEILDTTDIRYKFNIVLPDRKLQPGIDKSSKHVLHKGFNVATIDSPKEREELYTSEDKISHENENVDHIVKGRSIVFENTEY